MCATVALCVYALLLCLQNVQCSLTGACRRVARAAENANAEHEGRFPKTALALFLPCDCSH